MIHPALRLPSTVCAGALTCLLSSCFWIGTIEGYLPSGAGVAHEGPLLLGVSGESRLIPLPAGAALIVAASKGSVYPTPFEQILVDVSLLVPEGVGVEMQSPELVLASREWPEPRVVPIVAIEDWTTTEPEERVYAADAVVRGSARTNVPPGFGLSLVREGPRTQTSIPAVAAFELRLPAFRVDGQVVEPGLIRFETLKRFGVWIPAG